MERKEICSRTVNGSEQFSYWCSGTFIFFECRSVLNTTPLTNVFLSCTLLSMLVFPMMFYENM